MIPDFTIVVALDRSHLQQFAWNYPTWRRNKPSLLEHVLLIVYDGKEITEELISQVINNPKAVYLDWSKYCAESYGNGTDKWYNPRRYRMLASFVHAPAWAVETPYWMKIDTDATALGMDNWIDPEWFEDNPAIISHPWGFTRPANQMDLLDEWVQTHPELEKLNQYPPLKLPWEPGADRVCHPRIGSWCSFFRTDFTRDCSAWATRTCGKGLLPVPSQDGFLWYCAKRMEEKIVRPKMKARGWGIWSTYENVKRCAQEAMNGPTIP